jgi:hypothetical protein
MNHEDTKDTKVGIRILCALCVFVVHISSLGAEPADLALLRLEPLGLDAQRAENLDALFRAELERVAGGRIVSRATVEKTLDGAPDLRACTGAPACLSAIGRALGVRRVVWGSVGELGDSYVVNLKLVDAARGVEERRVEGTLRGSADDLIEEVRVAAHRLLAPEAVRGAVAVESDVRGARVLIDGRQVGRTPLARPVGDLSVGAHALRVEADGYQPFATDVQVRFQKTSEVAVRLAADGAAPRPRPRRTWISSPWTYAAVGAAAVIAGVLVGRALAADPVLDCATRPERCR